MHIILTHEQGDFDAIASLLGAALLDEKSIPVLPRRVNRNVQAFLNIYQPELLFVDQRDIPSGRIKIVTLVDTQSLVTLKGITKSTQINVVDHHKPRKDPPPTWQIKTGQTGACTTLFVEELQNRGLGLTSLQATLLLLGIYEDTGSLSYVSTTSRDVQAAAFLLEQGASLRIAGQFLNPPLSSEQRNVYDRLMAAAQSHQIHGQNVVISCISAEEMTEEISSIAHKLRDLLEPDALILVLRTNEGIRLIGRSTTDQIDVSRIMAEFGGGGHERAASALVRVESGAPTLEEVTDKLLTLLDKHVQPAITVGQIMSAKPITLAPETPAHVADQLMQRYGYEGYPVMRDGSVIGLLTRRSVDRALSHKLNLGAESLMEAGSITVFPQDTLDHLQRVMASSGWGQIPVIDPASRDLIGIVTRTDLLKTMGKEFVAVPGHVNLSDRLESALPAGKLGFLKLVAEVAKEHRFPIYIVGGFVRDLLLDRPGLDFDIVVEGDAIALGKILTARFGGHFTSHSRFGTAKWQIGPERTAILGHIKTNTPVHPSELPENLDLISARTEFYEFPTALPTIERSSIKLDLHRRDFTINTLALRLDGRQFGNLYDYWGGLGDIRKGIIRVLHSLSFVDDPTRMLRAVRFEQRFQFKIDERTIQLIDEAKSLLKQLSGDRVRHEFDLIFAEKDTQAMLCRMQDLLLLSAIHPALVWDPSKSNALDAVLRAPIDPIWKLPEETHGIPTRRMAAYLVWLANIPLDELMEITIKLRFSRPVRAALQQINLLLTDLQALLLQKPSQITARLEALDPIVLFAAFQLTEDPDTRTMLQIAQETWLVTQPFTRGQDLQALGLPPGPAYKYLLVRLRDAWLDGEINSQDQEDALLRALIPTIPPDLLTFTPR